MAQNNTTIEELVKATSSRIQTNRRAGPKCYMILDTGAVLHLYKTRGEQMFEDIAPGIELILPEEVLTELENQRDRKAKGDDHSLLCPYGLTDILYTYIGLGRLNKLCTAPDVKTATQIRNAICLASTKNNTRIGSGDFAVVNAALAMRNPEDAVIASCDSDVSTILQGLGVDVGFLTPNALTGVLYAKAA